MKGAHVIFIFADKEAPKKLCFLSKEEKEETLEQVVLLTVCP